MLLVLFSVFSDPWGKKGNTLSRTVYWWPSPRYDVKLNIVEQFHRYSLWWIWLSHHIDIQESLWNCSTIFKITTDKTNKSIQPQRYLKLWIWQESVQTPLSPPPPMDYNNCSDKMLLLKYGIHCLITEELLTHFLISESVKDVSV